MSKEIKTVSIIGMGALGLLFGNFIEEKCGAGTVSFVMNWKRYQKHKDSVYSINGEKRSFRIVNSENAQAADLVIFAVKSTGLSAALETAQNSIGPDTVIISVLNGISSEEIISGKYGAQNVVYTIALGMDAMRSGESLTYYHMGRLQTGIVSDSQKKAYCRLRSFFDGIDFPYEHRDNIMRAMWGKFMLNVGINQTCMVYDTTYGGALSGPESAKDLEGAMREVILLSQYENVNLSEEDLNAYFKVLRGLEPVGYPSMRQDALAFRPSEVEIFSGTVIRLAKKHGIEVPVNQKYYDIIQRMESAYPSKKASDSAGIIVFRKIAGAVEVLRIQTRNGNRSFPKGHIEEGESAEEAALREVLEETGIRAEILPGFSCKVPSGNGETKRNVYYFAGIYLSGDLSPQREEVSGAEWTPVEKAAGDYHFLQDEAAFHEAFRFYKNENQ